MLAVVATSLLAFAAYHPRKYTSSRAEHLGTVLQAEPLQSPLSSTNATTPALNVANAKVAESPFATHRGSSVSTEQMGSSEPTAHNETLLTAAYEQCVEMGAEFERVRGQRQLQPQRLGHRAPHACQMPSHARAPPHRRRLSCATAPAG